MISDRDRPDPGLHRELVTRREVLGADQHRGRAVGKRRRGARGHRTFGVERGIEAGQDLRGRARPDAAVALHRAVDGFDGNHLA